MSARRDPPVALIGLVIAVEFMVLVVFSAGWALDIASARALHREPSHGLWLVGVGWSVFWGAHYTQMLLRSIRAKGKGRIEL